MNENILSKLRDIFLYDAANPMLFNSGIFFVLFILFIIYYAFQHKNRLSITLFVIVFSVFFYYKSSGLYFVILVFTSITDYAFAIFVHKAVKKSWKRFWLIIAVWLSLGILFYFKYTNFVLENFVNLIKLIGDFPLITEFLKNTSTDAFKSFSDIASNNFQAFDIFLPIGISFYTFQSISYVLDVYQKKLEPTKNFLDYAFFLSFFPQLVAGPIVKANLFLPQLKQKITISKIAVWTGFWFIIIGLFKKAVIADYIAQYNDFVFAAPGTYSGFENLMAVLGYTLQIYGDFSGYSDIAIGLGMVMGFDLGLNFNFPYKSLNITDFWRRWHISLSSWLRDYLYIQLGGNKKGKWKMYRNLFLTMFLGGLWHGANWKFVVWGSMHGIGLAVHKALGKVLGKIPNVIPVKFVSWLLTFVFVITLWIFFRANDIAESSAKTIIKDGIDYEFSSQIIAETDTTKTVRVLFTENNVAKDTLIQTLEYVKGSKVKIKEELEGTDKVLTVSIMEDAYSVALTMIKQILTDTSIKKYAIPFWKAHQLWVILILIGFLMHVSPTVLTNKIIDIFVKSPYIAKLVIFILVVQIVIQLKSEDVVPFIYFQF